ncbi:MAG: hypothetical protein H5U40_15765, partial [Polyangiaceae bacterium]|nr:hypothetical protein [Polyangiaceae bacterium]
FIVEGGEGPFSVDGPFEADNRFILAHGVDAHGEVDRLYLNAWVDTWAPIGRTNFDAGPRRGERALVGRVFTEHVFTRPFAPAGERKVTRLDYPDLPAVPPTRYSPPPVASMLELPRGAMPIDDDLHVDTTPIVFGLRHTDSNQHVNSLVYPQLFEDTAIRRLSSLGLEPRVLARSLSVGYRKPCFAGQTTHVALALYRDGSTLGAYGGFYDRGDLERMGVTQARPHAFVRMTFSPAAR